MMIASSGFDGNPWADDSRTFGCLRNVLLLAERNGHCAEVRSVIESRSRV